jgi:hypothetical protein
MPSEAKYGSIVSEDEAVQFVLSLIDRQVDVATRADVAPNASASGDTEARDAFAALLSLATQRRVFLQLIKNHRFWPRIRTLIGLPPYGFLRPEDEGVLNATGIAQNRVNMTARASMLSSSEIGVGHFTDGCNRLYKVVGDDLALSGDIPVRRARAAKRLVLDARVAVAVGARERFEIAKRRDKQKERTITFPRVGEVLQLRTHPHFGIEESLLVTVRTVEAKHAKSPVCRLYCVR